MLALLCFNSRLPCAGASCHCAAAQCYVLYLTQFLTRLRLSITDQVLRICCVCRAHQVTDCHGQTAVATATLTYAPPIVATADAYIFHKAPYTVDAANGLLKNDAVPLACAATPPTFRVVTPPAQGTVVITAGGAFTYTSTSAVPVTDSFTYEVSWRRQALTK